MKTKALMVGICLVALGVGAYVSYFVKGGVIRYNDEIVGQVIASDDRFDGMYNEFEAYLKAPEASALPGFKDQIAELRSGVEDDLERYEAIRLKGGDAGAAFHEAGLNYLLISRAYVEGFERFLEYAGKNPENGSGQQTYWDEINRALARRSEKAMAAYLESQREFADVHGIEIREETE